MPIFTTVNSGNVDKGKVVEIGNAILALKVQGA